MGIVLSDLHRGSGYAMVGVRDKGQLRQKIRVGGRSDPNPDPDPDPNPNPNPTPKPSNISLVFVHGRLLTITDGY